MPPMAYGPNINATANLAKLNASSADIYRLISPQSKSSDELHQNMFWSFVDVRDVSQAHLRAYEVPEAGGARFSLCTDNFTYQKFVDGGARGFRKSRTACLLENRRLERSIGCIHR